MASSFAHFVPIDHDTPLLFPLNFCDWVPDGHLVHFILDAMVGLNLAHVRVNICGTGAPDLAPRQRRVCDHFPPPLWNPPPNHPRNPDPRARQRVQVNKTEKKPAIRRAQIVAKEAQTGITV